MRSYAGKALDYVEEWVILTARVTPGHNGRGNNPDLGNFAKLALKARFNEICCNGPIPWQHQEVLRDVPEVPRGSVLP